MGMSLPESEPLELTGGGGGLCRVGRGTAVLIGGLELLWEGSRQAVDWLAHRRRRHLTRVALRGSVAAESDPVEAALGTTDYTPATRRRYAQVARRFALWFATSGSGVAGAEDVARFLAEAVGAPTGGHGDPAHRGVGRTTICGLRATLEKVGAEGLTAGLRLPPHPPRRPAPEPAVVARLWEAARNARECLLLVLCCGLALRPGQMAALRWRDVDRRRRVVRFTSRGQPRQVSLPAGCHWVVRRYSRGKAPDDFLFPALAGGRARGPVTVRALQNALRALAERAGVHEGTTFESLRQVAATGLSPWEQDNLERSADQESRSTPGEGAQKTPAAAAEKAVPTTAMPAAAAIPPAQWHSGCSPEWRPPAPERVVADRALVVPADASLDLRWAAGAGPCYVAAGHGRQPYPAPPGS